MDHNDGISEVRPDRSPHSVFLKTIAGIFGVVAIIAFKALVIQGGRTATAAFKPDPIDGQLQDAAIKMNARAGENVGQSMAVRGAHYSNKTFVYQYKYLEGSKGSFTQEHIDRVLTKIGSGVATSTCTDSDLREVLKKGYSFTYEYVGLDGLPLGSFHVTDASCLVDS